jgi:hypothetical protein
VKLNVCISIADPTISGLATKTRLVRMAFMPAVRRWNLGGRTLQRFVANNLTWGSLRALRDVIDVMDRTSVEVYEARKKAIQAGSLPE